MASDEVVGTRYCLEHMRFCKAMADIESEEIYHMEATLEGTISGEDYAGFEKCFGPFTYSAPPDQLTDEEWSEIISQETEAVQW